MRKLVSGVALSLTLAMPALGLTAPKHAVPEPSFIEAAIRWVTQAIGIFPHEKPGKQVVVRDTEGIPTEQGSTTIDANG
jgi:hypothetical protein